MPTWFWIAFVVLVVAGLVFAPVVNLWAEAWRKGGDPGGVPEEEWFFVTGLVALVGAGVLAYRLDLLDYPLWLAILFTLFVWLAEMLAIQGIAALGLWGIRRLRARRGR